MVCDMEQWNGLIGVHIPPWLCDAEGSIVQDWSSQMHGSVHGKLATIHTGGVLHCLSVTRGGTAEMLLRKLMLSEPEMFGF